MNLRYILKRIVHAFFVILSVATVVFLAVRSIPGDTAVVLAGPRAPPGAAEALREELGLNRPIYVQYFLWLRKALLLDFGTSYYTHAPVTKMLIDAAKPTLSIGIAGLLLSLIIAIPTGIVSAVYRYRAPDYVATFIAFFGISMPAFWFGIILILGIGVRLDLLPVFGYVPLREGPVEWLKHVILPSIAIAFPFGGIIMRQMRSAMLEVLNENYMRTAKAKGLSNRLVLYKHGLQNSLIPVVTVIGIFAAAMIGGVVAVEIVFGYEGIGRLLIDSIRKRDFHVIQGAVISIAFVIVFMNLLIDILYTFINPRITYEGGE